MAVSLAAPVDRRATWQNPRIFSTLLLVFLAGATAGAVTMKFGLHNVLHRPVAGPITTKDDALEKLRVELKLTPQQTERIAAVLDDYRQYYQSVQEQLDDIRATGKTRILNELDPAQREKFQKIINEIPPQLAPKP